MGEVKNYDPKRIKVIFGGLQIQGFSEDSIVSIEPMGEGIKSICGADGEVARSLDPDQRCQVTINLLGTSSSNDKLSALHAADKATGKGMLPLLIKDLSGSTILAAAQAWVVNNPKREFGKEVGDVEWTLETGSAIYVSGGSN